jgi:hypothetical protein
MKKLVVAIAIILVAGSAYAQSVNGKMMLGVQGEYGLSTTAGEMGGIPGLEADADIGYGFGAKLGYGVSDGIMILAGAGYSYRPLAIKFSYYGSTGDLLMKQSYIDLDFGFRFLFSALYLDLEMYYGIRSGDMTYKGSGIFSSLNGKVRDGVDAHLANDYGFILGLGHLFKINENVAIDFEGKIKWGLATVYKEDDGIKLSDQAFLLSLGVDYTF